MKILLVTTLYPGFEGQSRKDRSYALHYFAKDWIGLGHEVKVINLWTKYPKVLNFINEVKKANLHEDDHTFYLDEVEVNRIGILRVPKFDYFSRHIDQALKKIMRLINGIYQPDVVVCHMFNPSIYIANYLKRKLNKPLFLTLHQTDLNHLLNHKKRFKNFCSVYDQIDGIGFRSVKLKEKFDSLDFAYKKNFVIPSGIEESILINEEVLHEKKQTKSKVIFVAASLIKLKNIDVLLRAFDEIPIEKDVVLRIAGDGPEKDRLIKTAQNLESKNKIQFLGYLDRDKVLDEMEKSDVFAMVSSPETFGLVYLEAMAKGCITIGSRGEGIDGVIKHEVNGFLCEPRNPIELRNVLVKALNLEGFDKAELLSSATATTKKMTQRNMSSKYLEILEEIRKKYV